MWIQHPNTESVGKIFLYFKPIQLNDQFTHVLKLSGIPLKRLFIVCSMEDWDKHRMLVVSRYTVVTIDFGMLRGPWPDQNLKNEIMDCTVNCLKALTILQVIVLHFV